VGSYSTNDFKKGLKVQIDGEPYQIVEYNFRKPGKGQALYECRMRNLIKGTMLNRTYRSGDTLESADVIEIKGQYLYRSGENYVFMDVANYEQYELTADQVGENTRFLQDGLECQMVLYNNVPITVTLPNHVVYTIEYTEPAAKGNTATNVTKPATLDSGTEIGVPAFVGIGDKIRVDTRTGEYVERVKE
jgi:elongation factor P